MADYGNGSRFERRPGFARGLQALLSGVTVGQQQNFDNQMKQQEVAGRQQYYDAYAQNADAKTDPMSWVSNLQGMVGPGGMRVKSIGPNGPTFEPDTPPEMTAGQRLAKDKATTAIFSMMENNKVKKDQLTEAEGLIDNVPQGLPGKVQLEAMKMFDPKNPALGDWQKIKAVATDAQLMNTAKTKGAISDQEMELFATAAGNDDLMSAPRLKPILKKLRNFIDAEEKSSMQAFKKLYGEDPMSWFQGQEQFDPMTGQAVGAPQTQIQGLPGASTPIPEFASEDEALASGHKGDAIVAGKRARID
jgi:hypothetical protein